MLEELQDPSLQARINAAFGRDVKSQVVRFIPEKSSEK